MPELPEVTYQKKYADATALHKEISKVEFGAKKIFQSAEKDIEEALIGNKFEETERLGKYLFLKIDSGKCLVLHFGMTGKLEFYQHEDTPKHAQLTLKFKDHSKLSYICPRKFGKIYLSESLEQFKKDHSLGPDALEISGKEFMELLEGKNGSIKGALTNQKLISGIGNLYSDEVLFQCKIHPKCKVSVLSTNERRCIFREIEKVLQKVIETKTSDKGLPDSFLTRHRKEGASCPNGNGKVEMIKVSGRSTYYCPNCQKEK